MPRTKQPLFCRVGQRLLFYPTIQLRQVGGGGSTASSLQGLRKVDMSEGLGKGIYEFPPE
jgi:hypothetical protein